VAAGATPRLLVAHLYTRYLGDLSGGQILKRCICKAMPTGGGGEGVAFYDFDAVDDAKAFKRTYRAQLDTLALGGARSRAIVEEANQAFAFNGAIFASLDARAGIAPLPPKPKQAKATSKCPFAALIPTGAEMPAGHPPMPPMPKAGGGGGGGLGLLAGWGGGMLALGVAAALRAAASS